MDAERRQYLKERQAFNRARLAARELRSRAEPAFSALTAAGEDFRLMSLADARHWGPDWLTGASYVQWREIPGSRWQGDFQTAEDFAPVVIDLVREVAGPDERIQLSDQIQFELTRTAFERHAAVLIETMWRHAFVTAERAQWLIEVDGLELWWKLK